MKEFLVRVISNPATVRKFFVAFVTVLGMLVSYGIFDGAAKSVSLFIIGLLNVYGVYAVKNKPDETIDIEQRLTGYRG